MMPMRLLFTTVMGPLRHFAQFAWPVVDGTLKLMLRIVPAVP